MRVQTEALKAGAQLDADVCIVGSGAAGISLAKSLHDAGVDTLLLEGGKLTTTPESQDLYKGVFEDPFNPRMRDYLSYSRLRYFGGTTNHWAGWCRPISPEVFAPRDWVPDSGWPISRADMNPWYRDAADLVDIHPFPDEGLAQYDAARRPPLPGFSDDRFQHRMFFFSRPTRFGQKYRDELMDSPTVRVALDASVVRLDTDPEGRHVASAACVCLTSDKAFTVRARRFVVAAGGIENPRLLLNSDAQVPGGLGNGEDLVGRYFADHLESGFRPHFRLAFTDPRLGKKRLHLLLKRARDRVNKNKSKAVLFAAPPLQKRERLLEHHFGLLRFDESRVGEIGGAAQQLGATLEGKAADDLHSVRVILRSEAAPNRSSRVRLVADRDRLGMRKIALEWRLTELDRHSHVRGSQLLAAELALAGVGRLQTRISEREDWARPAIGGMHHMGTTRMASSPLHGVVDANCKVFGVDNLWMAGSSVFPCYGSSNPTLTIVALARRLGAHLTRA